MTYADDLTRIARDGCARKDVSRVDVLARYLADLHQPVDDPAAYDRATERLVADISRLVGAFRSDESQLRLEAIEERCRRRISQLHYRGARLTRTHGDFRPENVVFQSAGDFTIEPSGGTQTCDPADDVMAMMTGYLVHAHDAAAWSRGLRSLWHRFWITYQHARPDPDLFAVAPSWFARHALAACDPAGSNAVDDVGRERVFKLVETALEDAWLDPMCADDHFCSPSLRPRFEQVHAVDDLHVS